MKKNELNTNRKCGPCSACCKTLGVPELKKEAGEECEHRCNGWKACKIYDDRPEMCRAFECMWIQGFFANKDRPNDIGIIVQGCEIPDVGPALTVHEIRQGASRTGRAAALIAKQARGLPVVIVPANLELDRRVVCDNPKIAPLLKRKLGSRAKPL